MKFEGQRPSNQAVENYNPSENVRLFLRDHGEKGQAVLEIFNEIDPRARYFGDDVNPDEYVGHARAFLEMLNRLGKNPTEEKIKEAVVDSFSANAEEDGFLNTDQIQEIGARVFSKFYLN